MDAGSYDVDKMNIDVNAVPKQYTNALISGDGKFGFSFSSTEIRGLSNDLQIVEGPNMNTKRRCHTSVTLPNGNIAVFGGCFDKTGLSSCELFNTKTSSWSVLGDMSTIRESAASVVLRNGLTLIIGGYNRTDNGNGRLNSCEFYNSQCRFFFSCNAKMLAPRSGHTASLLANGKVLVCGGDDGKNVLATTEIYDPATDLFSPGPTMDMARKWHTATTLPTGAILITGGVNGESSSSTEFYCPEIQSFRRGPNMQVERIGHFSYNLPDGTVIIGGGRGIISSLTTEIFFPNAGIFNCSKELLQRRCHSSVALF
jgi:hypothetical protein